MKIALPRFELRSPVPKTGMIPLHHKAKIDKMIPEAGFEPRDLRVSQGAKMGLKVSSPINAQRLMSPTGTPSCPTPVLR